MNYQKLLNKAEKTVKKIAGDNYSPMLLFHNIDHIHYVVNASEKIAAFSGLNDEDHFVLMIATWFYDIVPLANKDNYEAPKKYAGKFLADYDVSQSIVERVMVLIMATGSSHAPANLLEEIIRDAVTYYYGKKTCLEFFEQERKEKELFDQVVIERQDWLKQVLSLFQEHQFFTIFCKQSLEDGKLKNIKAFETQLNQIFPIEIIQKKNLKMTDQDKVRPEKAIDGMFRIAESNSQRLSSMADNKAHILITVNSIILSVVISILLRKLDDNRDLILPTVLLLAVSLTSMSFSIVSTRPSLPRLTYRPGLIEKENINLLFFGNFYHMSLETYQAEMHKMMDNSGLVYNCLIKDIYTEGKVLARKYKLLRISYNIFMFGLIAATLAFIIAAVMQPPKLTPSPSNNAKKVSVHHF